jgi:hypothetical protein
MNWETVQTDLFSEIPVVADTTAQGDGRFSPVCSAFVAGVDCLDAMWLYRIALVR